MISSVGKAKPQSKIMQVTRLSQILTMEFVFIGVLLVFAVAVPAAWPVKIDHQDDDAMIFPSFNYYCFSGPKCTGALTYVATYFECCISNNGASIGTLNFQCFGC